MPLGHTGSVLDDTRMQYLHTTLNHFKRLRKDRVYPFADGSVGLFLVKQSKYIAVIYCILFLGFLAPY